MEIHSTHAPGIAPEEPTRDLLTIDVEDYFQVEAFADRISRSMWDQYPRRVRRNTERLLDLLAKYQQTATFFVLGWVAEREPALVRAIVEAGHEIGCHSYAHRRVFTLSPEEFRNDLKRAKAVLEHACGTQIFGYRAPTFSICANSLWALSILEEEGFAYDSSIFPVRHDLYGMPNTPRFAYRYELPNGRSIIEVPASTVRLFGHNFPAAGGGYLRHLPWRYTRWAIKRIHAEKQPVNVYLHPWEIDPEQPRINGSWKSTFRHYRGLHKTELRLREMLTLYRFEPMINFVQRIGKQTTTQALSTIAQAL